MKAREVLASDFNEFRVAEFWSKVRLTVAGCMEFTGAQRNSQGYGVIEAKGRTSKSHRRVLAHRAAYAMTWGRCPADKCLLHSCDNKACVNPTHLRPGTQKENMADVIARGRHGMRGRKGPDHPLYGRKHSEEAKQRMAAARRARSAS